MLCFFKSLSTAVLKNYLLTISHLHPQRLLSAVSKGIKQVAQTNGDLFFSDIKGLEVSGCCAWLADPQRQDLGLWDFLVLSFVVVKGLLQLPTLRPHSGLEEGMALGLFPFIWEANFPTSLQHTSMYMPLAISS